MSLIRSKLENVVVRADGGIIARCPACAAQGRDTTGNHLVVFPDGRFGCVVFSGDTPEGREHRREIARLAGDGRQREQGQRQAKEAQVPGSGGARPVQFTVRDWQSRYPTPKRRGEGV